MCPDIDFEAFTEPHVKALAPHLMGDAVWSEVVLDDISTWARFK